MRSHKTLFAIDGNWYLNRAYSVLTAGPPPQDMERAICGMFLSMVSKDALTVRADYLVVAFDGDKIFRYKIHPGYKGSRKEQHAEQNKRDPNWKGGDAGRAVYNHLSAIHQMLDECGITWVQRPKYEADDICASASALACDELRVIIGTGDKDSAQLVTKYVKLFNSSTKPEPTWIDRAAVIKKFGVKPSKMIMFQTIMGDAGDDVIGLAGYGPKTTAKICNAFDTIKEWRLSLPPEKAKAVAICVERLRLNRTLVTLVKDAWSPSSVEELRVPRKKFVTNKQFSNYQAWLYPRTKGLF